ncbi:HNH endonuclease [Kamptonema sp. UHCC 0994]|uniref:HNH endonuclease n=1 Tax=Kamptonema sp. UHCC 0994 TaxID=3031329 RepID=UPI0023BACB6C|nr:HNH endonuclease [Kamptonema sp. UHCC 0994]MDF0556393.1 HNH endonuclease [Kamptonema sp. UHCC 0994]
MNSKGIDYYCRKFSQREKKSNPIGLNVSRSAGLAPNKPVLLLAVIGLIQRGDIQHNQIYLSPELIAAFLKLWGDLEINRKADIGLPFFHLKYNKFWHFKAKPGYELVESSQNKVKVRSISAIRQTIDYAYLDSELWKLLQHPESRNQLLLTLIDAWFSDKTAQIECSLQFNAFRDLQDQLFSTGGRVYQPDEITSEGEQESIVRDGAFRRTIISIYEHRCAFCGLQVFNSLENIVDGAHIKPFSKFYDDRINNGLSLCKNHHWAFDRFWFTLNDDFTIIVADTLREYSPHARPIKDFHGDRITLPMREEYRPRPDALQWHRQSFFERQV